MALSWTAAAVMQSPNGHAFTAFTIAGGVNAMGDHPFRQNNVAG